MMTLLRWFHGNNALEEEEEEQQQDPEALLRAELEETKQVRDSARKKTLEAMGLLGEAAELLETAEQGSSAPPLPDPDAAPRLRLLEGDAEEVADDLEEDDPSDP